MAAIQLDRGRSLSLVTPARRRLATDEVLITVKFSGVCGTDLHIVEGHFPCGDAPFIMGHEFCGVVQDVGCDVRNVKVGDSVAVDPNRGCGCCDHCRRGNYHYCTSGGARRRVGTFEDGGWATLSVQPADMVHRLPDGMSLQQAALAEPLSCISHGYDCIAPVPVGSRILIQGAGIIGNLWASILHAQGHRRVTVSEPQEARRKLLEKLETGYDIVPPDQVRPGVDLVIDCSGFAPAIEEAVTLINPGGKLCIFGVAPPQAKTSVSPYLLYNNELSIVAVKVNPFSFPKALGLMEAMGPRYLSYDRLGIRTYSLDQYEAALQDMRAGRVTKAMFQL